jgi:hypothetical protein
MVENRPMMMISIADYLPAKSRSPFLLPISSRQIEEYYFFYNTPLPLNPNPQSSSLGAAIMM